MSNQAGLPVVGQNEACCAPMVREPDAIARAFSYALAQPPDVDVNEIVVRPARQR
ncbi:hypothetical protein AB0B56_27545 [Streptosporangium canum]|uniref:hypothetical protein n=1 Tax=Streptosporangium canum TaxID=324952 RepID=UPI00341A084D